MIKEVTAVGKDILEAKENARVALGAGELDDVQFEIVDAGSKGIFGIIGVRPAKVRAFIELPDTHEKRRRNDRPKKDKGPDGGKKTERLDNQPKQKQKKQNEKKADSPKPSEPKSEVIPEAPRCSSARAERVLLPLIPTLPARILHPFLTLFLNICPLPRERRTILSSFSFLL